MSALRLRRAGATLLLVAIVAGSYGCDSIRIRASLFRADRLLWKAQRAEQSARLGGARVDSTTLLEVRRRYDLVRGVLAGLPVGAHADTASDRIRRTLIRTVGVAEMTGARLALEAGRADLAADQMHWLVDHAGGDTIVARQASFVEAGALRQLRRWDDAIALMHGMLRAYPPLPPDRPGAEDAILAMPEAIIELRRRLGDEDSVRYEQALATEYFAGLLREEPHPPMLEAQIRSRFVRVLLDRKEGAAALGQIDTLDALVAEHDGLRALQPEVRYARAKIRGLLNRDRSESIRLLDSVAAQYPTSPVGARALFDAGVYLEDQGRLQQAADRYRDAAANQAAARDIASASLFRLAMVQDRMGQWEDAQRTLQSVVVKYGGTRAALEAPMAAVEHYVRKANRQGAEVALRNAVTEYRKMLETGSAGPGAQVARWNIVRALVTLGKRDEALDAVDDMVENHPGAPLTARALLEGAKLAKANNLNLRASGYIRRFLEDFPRSNAAPALRKELEALGG